MLKPIIIIIKHNRNNNLRFSYIKKKNGKLKLTKGISPWSIKGVSGAK